MPAPDSPRRPRRSPRRTRRLDRPVDFALVRATALLLVFPLLLLLLSIGRPGPYPASPLPPSFDGASATALATELADDYPNREPGSAGATGAAAWVRSKLALYGLETNEDSWIESIPGLGRVRLRNLATVVPGGSPDAILVMAHRDDVGVGPGANDNASGTAALIELARSYGVLDTGTVRPKPMHTLVFLSSDGGAYGGYGAARFARHSRLRGHLEAVLSLDGLAGRGRPRLELAGYQPRSPTPALVRTANVRVAEQIGSPPAGPGWLAQLVDLGLPYGFGEQAPFLAEGISAVRLATAPDGGAGAATDSSAQLDAASFTRLGRAAESILTSLDGGVGLVGGTRPNLYLGSRVIRGWAIALLLLTALVPYLVGAVDLFARCRRRRLPLLGAWRALRIRVAVWLWIGLLVGLGALLGIFPTGSPVTPPPDSPDVTHWPIGWLAGLGLLAGAGWWRARRTLAPTAPATDEDMLAGYAVSLLALGATAIATALISPYGLLFLLPSLYAWLWLPGTTGRGAWLRDLLYGVGLVGPVLAVVAVGAQLQLGIDTPLYLISLLTLGFVPWPSVLALIAWAAIATQIGALAAGRYRQVTRRSAPHASSPKTVQTIR